MPQSTNVLSFISPHGGEATSRKGPPEPQQDSIADALRRIAEAALSATSASGAALALAQAETQEEGIVVCVARAGEMAPPLGAKLDSHSGISGECLCSGEALHCEDTETDSRVDRQACRALGLRSLAIAPVKHGNQVVGILEVFSGRPDAFNNRHLDVLRQLTELVLDDFDDVPFKEHILDVKPAPALVPSVVTQHSDVPPSLEADTAESNPATQPPVATTADIIEPFVPPTPKTDSDQALASSATVPSPTPLMGHTATLAPSANMQMPATPTPNDVNIAAYMAAEEAAHAQAKPRTPFVVLIGLAVVLVGAALSMLVWRKMDTQTQNLAANQPVQTASISPLATVTPVTVTPASSQQASKPDAGIPQNQALSPTLLADTRSGKPPLTKAAARDVVRHSTDIAGDTTSDVTRPIRVVDSSQRSMTDSDVPPMLATNGQGSQMLASVLNAPTPLPRRETPISEGVQGGELERKVDPLYPVQARTLRQEGTVVLQAFITESGLVRSVKVVSGPPTLGEAAAQAVKQWKYKPFQLNGKPVAMETQVKVTFKLP